MDPGWIRIRIGIQPKLQMNTDPKSCSTRSNGLFFSCMMLAVFQRKSSRVVRSSDCQCQSRYSPGFNPSILRHSVIGARRGGRCSSVDNLHKKEEKKELFGICLFTLSPFFQIFCHCFGTFWYLILFIISMDKLRVRIRQGKIVAVCK
jgi:hypothetical protein